jgi:hypothetical protein
MPPFDKRQLLGAVIARLQAELERVRSQALDAARGATHEDNRAEGDKDMRATEASYVARGLAERTMNLEQAVLLLSHLQPVDCSQAGKAQATALLELTCEAQTRLYFLLPAAGGQSFEFQGHTVHTLTPQSPLGRALLGLGLGDEVEVETPLGARSYEVTGLS